MKFKFAAPKKGQIQGVVLAAAAIGLLAVMLFIGVLLGFYSESEKKLSDRVYYGLSAINYFYATEKNINEFAQIVIETTAKELGEQCGGFSCYSWKAGSPSVDDLKNRLRDTIAGKRAGFPKKIGNGGDISFAPPKLETSVIDENRVKISLAYQSAYRQTDTFLVNASASKTFEVSKDIRYLLLAKIGQKLFNNGTYVRDWSRILLTGGEFDCNNDGAADIIIPESFVQTQLSDHLELNGCRVLKIKFDVDNAAVGWNSLKLKCYDLTNSADPGAFAGKIEGGKLYVQIDSLLDRSLVCGIDMTDGLASVTDTFGEVTKSDTSPVSCVEGEAGAVAWQKSNVPAKMQSILNTLANTMKSGQTQIDVQYSLSPISGNSYGASDYQAGWTVGCGYTGSTACGESCTSNPKYCKSGDPCVEPASSDCYVCGDCQEKINGVWRIFGSNCINKINYGYCCPKETPVYDSYSKSCFASSNDALRFEIDGNRAAPRSKASCDSCTSWVPEPWAGAPAGQLTIGDPDCRWHTDDGGTGFCPWRSDYRCTHGGNTNEGSMSTYGDYWWSGPSSCGTKHQSLGIEQRWRNGMYGESRTDYWMTMGGDGSQSSSYTYSCDLAAYFKFIFTPDISFRITDTSMKIVKKGTTDFENLYLAVKFKPSSPYVVGETLAR
jgi:hypothetical protein